MLLAKSVPAEKRHRTEEANPSLARAEEIEDEERRRRTRTIGREGRESRWGTMYRSLLPNRRRGRPSSSIFERCRQSAGFPLPLKSRTTTIRTITISEQEDEWGLTSVSFVADRDLDNAGPRASDGLKDSDSL